MPGWHSTCPRSALSPSTLSETASREMPPSGRVVTTFVPAVRMSGISYRSPLIQLRFPCRDSRRSTFRSNRVEGAARIASELGYRTIVLSDASSDAAHQASLESLSLLAEVSTADDFLSALTGEPAAG